MKSNKKVKLLKNVIKVLFIVILSALGLYYILKDDPKETFNTISQVKWIPFLIVFITILVLLSLDGLILTILAKRYNKKYSFGKGVINAQIGNFIGSFSKTSSNFVQAYTFTKQDIKGPNAASILTMNFLVYQLIYVLYSIIAVSIGFNKVSGVKIPFFNYMPLFPLSMIGLSISIIILAAIIVLSLCKPLHRITVDFLVFIAVKLHLSNDEEATRKKWMMRFVTYRLEFTKLWKHKLLLLVLVIFNIFKQLLLNSLPVICLWAMNADLSTLVFKDYVDFISASSYLQLISIYIPAGGAEVAFQNIYSFLLPNTTSSIISASNIFYRSFTFYFNLIVGGLCFILYKGSPNTAEIRYNTATIFDLEVINYSESADDKTREFAFSLIDNKKKDHVSKKKQLLTEEDVKQSFYRINKYMSEKNDEELLENDNLDDLEEQKKQLAQVVKESEELLKQATVPLEVKEITDKELSINEKRRQERKEKRIKKSRNKDKKKLEKMLFKGTTVDFDNKQGIKIDGPEIYEENTLTTSDPNEKDDD